MGPPDGGQSLQYPLTGQSLPDQDFLRGIDLQGKNPQEDVFRGNVFVSQRFGFLLGLDQDVPEPLRGGHLNVAANLRNLADGLGHGRLEAGQERPRLFQDFGNQLVPHVQTGGQKMDRLQMGMVAAVRRFLGFLEDFLGFKGQLVEWHGRPTLELVSTLHHSLPTMAQKNSSRTEERKYYISPHPLNQLK